VEPWLPAALDSACNQTLRDIEIICVDDGSTDGSLAILKSYAARDPRIRVLENGENRGTLYSRARAAIVSAGNYVLWLDPDDELSPDIAEKTLTAAQMTGADIVYFHAEEIRKNKTLSPSRRLLNVPPTKTARNAAEIFPLLAHGLINWNLWARLWRGELMRAVVHSQLDFASQNHITWNEDLLLFYFLVKEAKTYAVLPDIGYRYYGTHGGICTRNDSKKAKCDTLVRRAILADDGPGVAYLRQRFHW
jgi:glycosyltransferase involved in cell wall biosynthesis